MASGVQGIKNQAAKLDCSWLENKIKKRHTDRDRNWQQTKCTPAIRQKTYSTHLLSNPIILYIGQHRGCHIAQEHEAQTINVGTCNKLQVISTSKRIAGSSVVSPALPSAITSMCVNLLRDCNEACPCRAGRETAPALGLTPQGTPLPKLIETGLILVSFIPKSYTFPCTQNSNCEASER